MASSRPLGRSGMRTPNLVLGGNVFGWTSKPPGAFDLIERFLEGGGTMIDTADVYSAWIPGHQGGESETVLGEWLAGRKKRDDVLIATKVGMLTRDKEGYLAPEKIAAAVEASLNRLQTDYIDLYYAHRDDPGTPQDEVLDAFRQLVEAGKVKTLGASNFSAERLASALEISNARGWPRYEVLQPELNLVAKDGFAGALQQVCIDNEIGVLPYFGLASGFLTGKYRSEADLKQSPRGFRVKDKMTPEHMAVLDAMDAIASDTGASLSQIALAWVAAQPGVTAPIASATSLDQLDELMGSLALNLSDEQLAALDAVAL